MQGALYLEDGSIFLGHFLGNPVEAEGEVVFSTGMVGYPQSFTDPSYEGQILVSTYPLIGNYGVPGSCQVNGFSKNFESPKIHIKGLIISSYIEEKTHWQAKKNLNDWLKTNKITVLEGVDTRRLTQKLREKGVMLGKIIKIKNKTSTAKLKKKDFFDPNKVNLASQVSCKKAFVYKNGPRKILLIDCGVKHSILKNLFNLRATIIRSPWDFNNTRLQKKTGFSLKDIQGVVISNGPGNPKKLGKTITFIREILKEKIPTLGICFGNQLLCLAAGGNTFKLKYGHRSVNQPVLLKGSKKAFITSQNHGYAAKMSSLGSAWQEWFVNLNDGTNEGIKHKRLPFGSVQFHPEGNPGPKDTNWIFDDFFKKLR